MAVAINGLQLFVTIIIALSFLTVSSFHLQTSSLVHHERQAISSPDDTLQMRNIEAEHKSEGMEMVEDELLERRMEFEINRDYPGSGANNRHTPNPPVKD